MPIINNFPSGGSSSANIVYGTYTGNSTENNGQQIINLGFTPLMLIVIDEEYQFTTIAVNDGKKKLGNKYRYQYFNWKLCWLYRSNRKTWVCYNYREWLHSTKWF